MAVRSVNLGVEIGGKAVYVNGVGLKVGVKGAVEPAGIVLGKLSKGEARKARKALHARG